MINFRKYCVSAAILLGMALAPWAVAQGKNAIEAVSVVRHGGVMTLKVDLSEPLGATPSGFSITNPPRLAFDFVDVDNGLGKNTQLLKEGDLTSLDVVQAGNRTRLVLNLVRTLNYTTKVEGSSFLINFVPAGQEEAVAEEGAEATVLAVAKRAVSQERYGIRDISFRRGEAGEARVIVDMSDPNAGVDVRQQGKNLVVEISKTTLPDNLRRRLDVRDFATPVTSIVTEDKAGVVKMVIAAQGQWEHNAYQTENQLIVEVKAIVEDPNKLVQGTKIGYQGPRISINYQNGDVRTLLRLMAEELGLNTVISETVVGTTTLVLKDVPADQVIDIIFRQKGLDMRKNGNVMLIAPRDELAIREKLEFESLQQMEELEPLRTETFQLNYHKADAFKQILTNGEQRILSKRGSAVIDSRSNIIFVQDVPGRLEDVRKIIARIDIPLRQVMIEARIVEASDNFAKNLGIRLGLLTSKIFGDGGTWVGMGGENINTQRLYSVVPGTPGTPPTYDPDTGAQTSPGTAGTPDKVYFPGPSNPSISMEGNPTFPQLNQVNMPANGYGGAQPSLFSFLLTNGAGTRMLNMEISALEADLKGRIVSSPRILTSDQSRALIEQGVEIPYQEASNSGSTSTSFKKAVLSLEVVPHITPDGKISMNLKINKDSRGDTVPGGVAINTKKVETDVLVENGGTVIIGGIYELTNRNDVNKVPLLGDIPLLGWAFKQSSQIEEKSELLVFITPRIVNESLSVSR